MSSQTFQRPARPLPVQTGSAIFSQDLLLRAMKESSPEPKYVSYLDGVSNNHNDPESRPPPPPPTPMVLEFDDHSRKWEHDLPTMKRRLD